LIARAVASSRKTSNGGYSSGVTVNDPPQSPLFWQTTTGATRRPLAEPRGRQLARFPNPHRKRGMQSLAGGRGNSTRQSRPTLRFSPSQRRSSGRRTHPKERLPRRPAQLCACSAWSRFARRQVAPWPSWHEAIKQQKAAICSGFLCGPAWTRTSLLIAVSASRCVHRCVHRASLSGYQPCC
jgi:hypothetical protein